MAPKQASQILALEERLVALLEQTEDAADDKVGVGFLAARNRALADDLAVCLRSLGHGDETATTPHADTLPLVDCLGRAARGLNSATLLLEENKPAEAIASQDQALDALQEAGKRIAELAATRTSFAAVLATAATALSPGPLLGEIEAEQTFLAGATERNKADSSGQAALVIPQKNLVHAVNAVLTSLETLTHRVNSGTVMLFAKEDMDAAAVGLETGDVEEALDAQSAIVESLQDLRANLDEVTERYAYVRELAEFLCRWIPEGAAIQAGIRQLQERPEAALDAEAVTREAEEFGSQLRRLTGEDRYAATASRLLEAVAAKDAEAALEEPLEGLRAQTADLQTLIKNLAYLITPPVSAYVSAPSPEVALLEKALDVAAHQQNLSRKTHAAAPGDLAAAATRQRELAERSSALCATPAAAPATDGNPAPTPHPNLVAAQTHMLEAAAKLEAGERDAAVVVQGQANDALRHFVLEYAFKYVLIPPPSQSQPSSPVDLDEIVEQEDLPLFEPGALTGTKPRGGRGEWEVLGRRDRAALNENFARELPLEYRGMLKDYYERLTQ
jgi:hypothetical protein